ncbi:transposase [Anaerococcus vaginimassiliensis]|uniref:transposase n=1 Tax=Anaerococcus vaginimassiliensis TaxID=2042308 RepID=UPI003BF90466
MGDKVKNVCIAMYSSCVLLIKELFVNVKIIIDWFHIIKLFTNSFNHASCLILCTFLNAFILQLVYYLMMILLKLVFMFIRL